MARPLWFVNILKKLFPNIKQIAKLTKIPILTKVFDILLFNEDDIIYLPLDRVVEVNKSIDRPESYVLPSEILEYFIEKSNYHWIMNFCICRKSMNCQNYPINLGCLFLGEGVLDINPELGRLVSKEEALQHIKKCRDDGLVHMIGRNLLDKQWLGVKDGNKLLSICNCCECCCLWRISPILHKKIGSKIKKMPGVQVEINHEKCIRCGKCLDDICFVNSIKEENGEIIITEECRGCGRCADICPADAIKLNITDKSYVRKSIVKLDRLIDVV